MTAVAPLLIGFAFGWVLQKGRLGRYETIVNVFLFRDLTVVKFLVSALLVGALGVQTLVSLGVVSIDLPVPQTFVLGNLAGGFVFGAAMALTGFCPGTVAAGAGEGRLDYLVPGALGLYTGAVVFGAIYPACFAAIAGVGDLGATTLARVLHASGWLVVTLLWELGGMVFYLVERGGPLRTAQAR